MASILKTTVKNVLLSDQSTWDTWFQNIKSSIQDYLWIYFNPDSTVVFVRPIEPVEPLPDNPLETLELSGPNTQSASLHLAKTPNQRVAREAKFKKEFEGLDSLIKECD